ncbi:hypothetical protein C0995_010847 [Termitomyces sp. Mi166|nr:hypothetical protein C0995_010847 [Termitomyces sp. Mi166\
MELAVPISKKLEGYEFYREVLGSPKFIVAPMVDQSVSKADKTIRCAVYTPMIHAKMFADTTHKFYREQYFDIASGEEGASSLPSSSDTDRPLIVQFCANDPETLLQSAKLVEAHCDAVDINLGCPQDIAKKGHYGSFLQDEWDLIYNMINTLHKNLAVPVTAKFRVFPEIEKTVEYAKMLERAGAQILTCHGRMREQRGQNTGLASYAHIAAVKRAVSVPVFANGNILFASDVQRCLDETGADGVMSAEGVLYNPALFRGLSVSTSSSASLSTSSSSHSPPSTSTVTATTASASRPKHPELINPPTLTSLALEYLSIVRIQRTRTSPSAVKGHLFKILRPALGRERYHDLRERMGRVKVSVPRRLEEGEEGEGAGWTWVDAYVRVVEEVQRRLEEDVRLATKDGTIPLEELVVTDEKTGLDVLPWWIAQPYFRPLPTPVPVPGNGWNAKVKAGKADAKANPKADAKLKAELLHDSTNSTPGTGPVPAKRHPPDEPNGDGDMDAGTKRVRLAAGEGGVGVGAGASA